MRRARIGGRAARIQASSASAAATQVAARRELRPKTLHRSNFRNFTTRGADIPVVVPPPMAQGGRSGRRWGRARKHRDRCDGRRIPLDPPSKGRGAGAGRFRALDGVGFEVGGGEMLGVIGHNGSGKSALLGLLGCVMAPDAGEIARSAPVTGEMRVAFVRHWSEDNGKCPEAADLLHARRTLAAPPPAVADPALVAGPRRIGEPQFDPFSRMLRRDGRYLGQQARLFEGLLRLHVPLRGNRPRFLAREAESSFAIVARTSGATWLILRSWLQVSQPEPFPKIGVTASVYPRSTTASAVVWPVRSRPPARAARRSCRGSSAPGAAGGPPARGCPEPARAAGPRGSHPAGGEGRALSSGTPLVRVPLRRRPV